MTNMATITLDNNTKKKRRLQQQQRVQTVSEAQSVVSNQVFYDRRDEIHEYLKLFGYKQEKTIIQVHIPGFFHKRQPDQRKRGHQESAIKRYGGTSFVIVGRTHDPSIMECVIKPKKRNPLDTSPGYLGYLWKDKDPQKRAPHEVIPLDFTPISLPYPTEWKNMLATKGFMLALHVPSSFARYKNRLTRALYRVGKSDPLDIRKEWKFINELRQFGFNNIQQQLPQTITTHNAGADKRVSFEDPIKIIKRRLAKGEINKEELEELRNAIHS